ncbi:PIN domain-containing protein [bacterium]|nr:MAG: PIN domain-containing protein [bacterium]
MNDVVVDSSAILAYLQSEPGMDLVESAVERSGDIIVASINFAEVVSKLVDRGAGETSIRSGLAALDLVVHPLDEALAYAAGLLRASTRSAGNTRAAGRNPRDSITLPQGQQRNPGGVLSGGRPPAAPPGRHGMSARPGRRRTTADSPSAGRGRKRRKRRSPVLESCRRRSRAIPGPR